MRKWLLVCAAVATMAGWVTAFSGCNAHHLTRGCRESHGCVGHCKFDCPHHPGQASDRPGNCTTCGFKLMHIPVDHESSCRVCRVHNANDAKAGPCCREGGECCGKCKASADGCPCKAGANHNDDDAPAKTPEPEQEKPKDPPKEAPKGGGG